jgi:hypothetical protein
MRLKSAVLSTLISKLPVTENTAWRLAEVDREINRGAPIHILLAAWFHR